MEDVSVRAIMIGVGVLIAVATISAVMMYYNTAKETVRKIGSGTDIAGMYEKDIEETLLKKEVTGTDVKNILNYFYGRNDAKIRLVNVKVIYKGRPDLRNISGELNDDKYKQLIKFIMPNSKYIVTHSILENNIIDIEIRQN